MKRLLTLFSAILVSFILCSSPELIDHYSTIWPSGYGKMAFDGDTLYLNTMNGHAVERYDIEDPANPDFIDREEVSGFDQIDFERRVMATERGGKITLTSFTNFAFPQEIFRLDLSGIGGGLVTWKYRGDAVFTVANDDTIRAYDISDPGNPHISSVSGLIRRSPYSQYATCFGNSLLVSYSKFSNPDPEYFDVYDIRNENDIHLAHTYNSPGSQNEHCYLTPAKGDTIAVTTYNSMSHSGQVNLSIFSITDSLPSELWAYGDYDPPPGIAPSDGGFIVMSHSTPRIYSYNNFALLGLKSLIPGFFSISERNYLISSQLNNINVFQPTYSESLMPEVYADTLESYGILSVCAYGDFVLAGAESNGGELLVHAIGDDWDIYQIGTLRNIRVNDMIISGSSVICLGPEKITRISLANPGAPVIANELSGFNGQLIGFKMNDSTLYAITDRAYYVIGYDTVAGMTVLAHLDFEDNSLKSIGQYQTASVVLNTLDNSMVKISAADRLNPEILEERQLRPDTFQYLNVLYGTIWACGKHGTELYNIYSMDSVYFYGPEYFSDVRRMYVKIDTLIVADGVNGLKVFSFEDYPYAGMNFIGGYETGNAVNQVAIIERNFYVSDYYSLQHLRWGAPDAIGGNPISQLPDIYRLEQNYPNPFNSSTSITYAIPGGAQSTLNIYDICGRSVRGIPIQGSGSIIWNGRDDANKPVSSGVYFYKIAGQPETARKMLLIK